MPIIIISICRREWNKREKLKTTLVNITEIIGYEPRWIGVRIMGKYFKNKFKLFNQECEFKDL